jgi:hypothetical protein
MDTRVEEGRVESSNNDFIDEEEYLLKLKDKVIYSLEEAKDNHYSFDDIEEITKKSLVKYQNHFMALKKILKKQEESETKQRTQLGKKEEEIKKLKTDIIIQAEEKKKVDDELSKILEDIK